jgi:hypothetical protein
MDVPAGHVKIWPSWALQFLDRTQSNDETWKLSIAVPATLESVTTSKPSRVNIPVARAKRLESRNISEEEQAAALAAPARAKRAPRVDYKKLAAGKK